MFEYFCSYAILMIVPLLSRTSDIRTRPVAMVRMDRNHFVTAHIDAVLLVS